MKTCSRCGVNKPETAFATRGIRDGQRLRRAACRACTSLYNRAAYEDDPEAARRRTREYVAANRDLVARRSKERYDADPVKYRRMSSQYAAERPEWRAWACLTQVAKKIGAPGAGLTLEEYREVHAEAMGVCPYCSSRAPLVIDHIDPLSRGGAHERSNVVAVCRPCNSSKNNRPLAAWMIWRATRSDRLARDASFQKAA